MCISHPPASSLPQHLPPGSMGTPMIGYLSCLKPAQICSLVEFVRGLKNDHGARRPTSYSTSV